MLNQHEREIILDAVLDDSTQEVFTEGYFYNLLKKHDAATPDAVLQDKAKAGVKKWTEYALHVDETRQIPEGELNILGSILANYCEKKSARLAIGGFPDEVILQVCDNLLECDDICKKLGTDLTDDNFRENMLKAKEQYEKKL